MRIPLTVFIVGLSAATASAGSVDPSVLDAIRKVKPADYPSANTVLVENSQSVTYQPDGQFTNVMDSVRLVLTASGKAGAANISYPYARDAEKLEVLSAQVIKKDGTVVPVAADAIKDTEQSGEMNIYDPNGRAIQISFAGLAVGDAVEARFRLTRTAPTRQGYFADMFDFQRGEPVLHASYEVNAPASLPLVSEVYHPERSVKIESETKRDGDRIHYRWSLHNQPQLVPEMLMNPQVEIPMLVVTTDPSWEHFSAWWHQVSEPKMQITDALKQKAAELTKDKKTPEEKIRALYDFVSSDVRYRGLGVGPRTGYTPRSAQETYTSRWGVCRDVAILLATMLRAEGFEAYPVLTNMGAPVLPKIAHDGFNHAIVAMPAKDGWTYLDPTAKNNTDLLPGMEREQNALVCTPKGEKLGVIPAGDPAANLGRAAVDSVLGEDGVLTSKIKITSKGVFDLALRSMAAAIPLDKQREVIESVIHSALPQAEIVSYHISGALFMSKPMEMTVELRVPGAAVKAGDYQLLSTVVTSGAVGLLEAVLPTVLGGLPTRKYALDAQVTFQYDEDETVTLPAGAKVLALPNPANAANRVSSLTAKCQASGPTTFTCKRSFQLKSRFIDPGQYTELRSVLATLGQIAHQPVILGGK